MTAKQIDKILRNKKIIYVYIRKHGSYYKPNCQGYTDDNIKAGIYPKEYATQLALQCGDLILIPIDVFKHNLDVHTELLKQTTELTKCFILH